MWQFVCSRIFIAIVFFGAAHGLFVVGPKYIRPNQEYKLVIANHNPAHETVNLMLRIGGEADNGQPLVIRPNKVVLKRSSTAESTFKIPEKLPPGQYKVIIEGTEGFSFHEEAELMHQSKSVSGLIQINKPVFKAGDTVQFRVIVLDTDLKPPTHVESIQVTIRDAQGNLIRKWSTAKLYAGVFDGDLPISSSPMFGTWSIAVQMDEEELVSKTFEVKEYVLSSFGLQVIQSGFPLEVQQCVNLTIVVKDHFGKLVRGSAKFELYLEEDTLDHNRSVELYGMEQVQLKFNKSFDVVDDASNVRVRVTFTEQYTNRTETKEIEVPVYKHPYRVELIPSKPQFLPGHAFPCVLKFTYHDGRPAAGIRGTVEEFALEFKITATSDKDGVIEFELRPNKTSESMEIQFSNDAIDFSEIVNKGEASSNVRHTLTMRAPVVAKLNEVMKNKVKCSEKMTFLVYYMLSKGNIIASGFRTISSKKSYTLDITTTERMMPKTKLVVATVVQRTLVYDYQDIEIGDFHNGFNLSIDENEIKPGRQIVLTVTGRPGSYVGLASYDASLASTMLGLQTDAIEKVIRVLPESLVQQKVETQMFCSREPNRTMYTFNLGISNKADQHSEKIAFRLNPNILTNVIQNLDNLIKLPTGCGEQNMINFVPNIIALDYLKAMISTNTSFGKLIEQSTDFLRKGYQNQMEYRKDDGAFSVFQHRDGSVFLTAFVAKSMQAASKHIDVDKPMIDKAYAWLASKQDRTGRFDEVGYIYDKEIQGGLRNGIALTSYVLIALLEHPELKTKYEQIVRKGLNYLDSKFSSIDNAYDLSLATYALMLSDHSRNNQALNKLIAMSTYVSKTDERYWNTTNNIEATAYALLSFVQANKYQEAIPMMHWLLNQRTETGSFGGTQNTFVGLQALTTFAKNICPFENEYSADLKLEQKNHKKFRMNTNEVSIGSYNAIEKVIRVLPESLVQQKVETQMFCSREPNRTMYTFNLGISNKADQHSEKIAFRLNPNILTTVIQNLDNLIKLPTGCGEQNMIKFVPNIIALDYLKAMISTNTSFEKSIEQATDFLRKGYQNQMGYRKKDGAFSVFHSEDGSVFLTAFVAKSMQAASKHIDVDKPMIDKAYAWLASKQDSTGRFDEVGYIFDKEIQGGLRNGIALTSYVLIALLEHSELKTKYEQIVWKGLSYLDSKFSSIDNAYDLSLATYAFMLSDHSRRHQSLDKLIAMSTFVRKTDERYWNTTNNIEATAYALLSFVKANKYQEAIPMMHWLLNQRYETGSFEGTQNTFVGLQALTTFAKNICPFQNEYFADLKIEQKNHKNFRMNNNEDSIGSYSEIPKNTRTLEVDVGGKGFGLLEVIYEYTLNLQNFSHRFDLSLQKQDTGSDYALELRVCASFIPIGTDTRSNMALVEVNFPSGYVAEPNPISQATKGNPIEKIELRFGGSAVVVYYMNMGSEKNCFTVTAYKRFKVALIHSAFVTVYDYYDTDLNAIKVYDIKSQTICEICEKGSCPEC
uniref:TEP1-F n=1 Tax=Anopheles dirus TaxID=7168 RepID=A0A3F2YVY5_9DIPT